jgi:hypothetical protein
MDGENGDGEIGLLAKVPDRFGGSFRKVIEEVAGRGIGIRKKTIETNEDIQVIRGAGLKRRTGQWGC